MRHSSKNILTLNANILTLNPLQIFLLFWLPFYHVTKLTKCQRCASQIESRGCMLVQCSVAFEVRIILFLVTILSYQQSFWTTCNHYYVSYFLRQNECITCLWHYKRQGQTFHSNFMGNIVLLSSSVGQKTAFPNYPWNQKNWFRYTHFIPFNGSRCTFQHV